MRIGAGYTVLLPSNITIFQEMSKNFFCTQTLLRFFLHDFLETPKKNRRFVVCYTKNGEVPEWSNGLAWKASVPVTVPRVRISSSPQKRLKNNVLSRFFLPLGRHIRKETIKKLSRPPTTSVHPQAQCPVRDSPCCGE